MKLSYKITLLIFGGVLITVIWSDYFIPEILDKFLTRTSFFKKAELPIARLLLTLVFVVTPVFSIIFVILNSLVIKKIVNFTKVTKIIASGNLGPKFLVNSKDELGELAQNLNLMTKNLANAFQSMSNSLKETMQKEVMLSQNVKALEQSIRETLSALSELNQEKEQLAESKAKDEALLENIGDGVIATDSLERIIFINKEAENILEWKNSDLSEKIYSEVIPSFKDEKGTKFINSEQPIRRALVSGKRIGESCFYKRKDGSIFSASVVASPVMTKGAISGVIVVFRDVTKEKEIDRMKTEFISLASHQLRTPLSAIKWFTELLLDESSGKLNDEQKELAKNVSLSAERMVELVNSLLNISRIESGRIIVEPVLTDLVDLVKEVVGELQQKITEKKHHLVVSANPQLPKINIDPKLIRQVYMNLLTNAIKYTHEGGEIVVFISRKGDEVISQVSDNGYGIPKEQHSKVFEKFFRAENIVKVETDGNGLGMYLVRAIIESSSGKIWFESEENKGTTFWFSLPLSGMKAKKGEVSLDS